MVTLAEVPVLGLGDAVVNVVEEDMLREARRGGKGREIARRGHTDGERRVISYTRRHSRGGCRATVIIYRSRPLGGEGQ